MATEVARRLAGTRSLAEVARCRATRDNCAPFNLVPRPGPGIAPQMAGWFRKKINAISDYKGLRMRIPNLGGKVIARAGGTPVLTPGADIYAALERGAIDAAEWVGPHDDIVLGLHRTVSVSGHRDHHLKNAIALERLKTEHRDKVEVLLLPAPVLRDLRRLAAEVVRAESEKSPMGKKVHASFAKFQAQVGAWTRSPRAHTSSMYECKGSAS